MDTRQLKYFIAVAEELNFTRAAQRLNISQPPLTRHINMLEASLGVRLFERTNRGVMLTDAGHGLLNDARNIDHLVQHAAERARQSARGETGVLDVGVHGSSMLNIIPRLLASFTEEYPDVRIQLHHAYHTRQVEALRQRRVLIAFDRYLPEEPDLAMQTVICETPIVALHVRNPLAALAEIPLEALRNEPMLVPGDLNARTHNAAMTLFRENDFTPRVFQSVTDLITTIVLVSCGQSVSIVPDSMQGLAVPGVVYRPLQGHHPAFMSLNCFYMKNETSPLLKNILGTIQRFRETCPPATARTD